MTPAPTECCVGKLGGQDEAMPVVGSMQTRNRAGRAGVQAAPLQTDGAGAAQSRAFGWPVPAVVQPAVATTEAWVSLMLPLTEPSLPVDWHPDAGTPAWLTSHVVAPPTTASVPPAHEGAAVTVHEYAQRGPLAAGSSTARDDWKSLGHAAVMLGSSPTSDHSEGTVTAPSEATASRGRAVTR